MHYDTTTSNKTCRYFDPVIEAFLHLPISEGKEVLAKILEYTPRGGRGTNPKSKEWISIAEILSSTLQDLVVKLEPPASKLPKK